MPGSSGKPTQIVVPTGTQQTNVTVHFDAPAPDGHNETYVDVGEARARAFQSAFDGNGTVDTTGANGSDGGTVTLHK